MSDPNTWAKATVVNDWGGQITNVYLDHRYDEDHFDKGHWNFIDNGRQGEPTFDVGYWTGFLRTGKDYWVIRFTDFERRHLDQQAELLLLPDQG